MIMGILELRARARQIYQKFQLIIDPVMKFIIGFIIFTQINQFIGFDARFSKTIVALGLALLSAFTPSGVMVLLAMLLILAHIYSMSIFLAILVLCIFLILYCLFLRFAAKYGLVVVGIPILTMLHMPYAIPIYLGISASPITILPTVCGVFCYYLLGIIKEAANIQINSNVEDILQLYIDVVNNILKNKQMIALMICYTAIILVVYFIRKLQFEYVFEIAIGSGVLVSIVGALIAILKYRVSESIGLMILMNVLSGILVLIALYIRRILDYTAIERVQFEDDDYYYYVKAVPKIEVSVPKRQIQHINQKKEDEFEDEFHYTTGRFSKTAAKKKPSFRQENVSKPSHSKYEDEYEEDFILEYESKTPKKNSVQSKFYQAGNLDEGYEVEMELEDDDF